VCASVRECECWGVSVGVSVDASVGASVCV
jgi:hypothetical protein